MVGKLRHDADLKYLFTGEQKASGRKRKFDGKVFNDDMRRFEPLGEIELAFRPGCKPSGMSSSNARSAWSCF